MHSLQKRCCNPQCDKKRNPQCDYFVENVEFKDLDDWQALEKVPGSPLIVNSANLSYTAKRRVHWTNFDVPQRDIANNSKRWKHEGHDVDYDCMDPVRTLVKTRNSRGKKIASPFGKSWAIKHGRVIEGTSKHLCTVTGSSLRAIMQGTGGQMPPASCVWARGQRTHHRNDARERSGMRHCMRKRKWSGEHALPAARLVLLATQARVEVDHLQNGANITSHP